MDLLPMGLLAFSAASFSSESVHLFAAINMSKLTTGATGGSGSSGDFSLFEKLTASDFSSVLISKDFVIFHYVHFAVKILTFYLVVVDVASHLVNPNIY